jgi:hypothetical protein
MPIILLNCGIFMNSKEMNRQSQQNFLFRQGFSVFYDVSANLAICSLHLMILYVDKFLPHISHSVPIPEGGHIGRNMLQSTLHLK